MRRAKAWRSLVEQMGEVRVRQVGAFAHIEPVHPADDGARGPDRLLSVKAVMEHTGLSRSSLWRLERAGAFPSRVQKIGRRVAWLESDVRAWTRSRPPSRLA